MSRDAEVAIILRDLFSSNLKKIREQQSKFTQDLDGMQKRLNEINKTKAELKIDTAQAKRELDAAKKAYEELNDAARKDALVEAQHRFDTFSDSLKETAKQANAVKQEMEKLAGVESKMSNSGGVRAGGDGAEASFLGTASAIMSSQLVSQLSGSVSSYLGTAITSAYGSGIGSTVSNVSGGLLSGAGAGLALGSIIPGIGTAAGAAIGAAVGLISGIIKDVGQKSAERDDLFRSTVEDIYGEVSGMRQEMLLAGSSVAAQRETDLTAFATLLRDELAGEQRVGLAAFSRVNRDGSLAYDDPLSPKAFSQRFLSSVVDFAKTTPFEYSELTSISKTLLTYGYQSQEIIPLLRKIGDAGAALGWDEQGKVSAATYIGRMAMSDKVTMQYLNPLIAQGLDVIGYIRESLEPALGELTNRDVMEMVSKNELSGKAVSEVLLTYMGNDFEGSMKELQNSYNGLLSTLEDLEAEMQNAIGEGYNERRKGQMQEQIDWYEANGDELKRLYKVVGEYEADLLGEKERVMRESMDNLLEQAKNIDDPKQLSQDLYNAIVDAQVEYYDTDAYNEIYGSQQALVKRIQTDLAQTNYDCGYALGQEFSKGYKAAVVEVTGNETDYWDRPVPNQGHKSATWGNFAYGISRIPHDNYPAMLHEGERVLTAGQARAQDRGGTGGVLITGNTFIVRDDTDIDAIASALYDKLSAAEAVYAG